MTKGKIKNVAASVRNRLLSLARQTGKPFEQILVLYALERFLFRLSQAVYKETFILKGGLLLIGMGFPGARTTRDIDFLGLMSNDRNAVSKAVKEIGEMDLNDGLFYDFSQLKQESISPDSKYPGVKLKFEARLGQARIPIQIDIGFGDSVIPSPVEMKFPTLLNTEPPVIIGYSKETVIAEKFEAALDMADLNSRMKDFYDIWGLSRQYSFDGQLLQNAITATCAMRKTTIRSDSRIFSSEFVEQFDKKNQWSSFIKKGSLGGAPEDFSIVMAEIREFLLPVVEATENDDIFPGIWPVGGPWSWLQTA